MIQIPPDFKEFLRLLNFHQVEYLLIGGYAVGYYGFVRATGDMDIWVNINTANATNVVAALKEKDLSLSNKASSATESS